MSDDVKSYDFENAGRTAIPAEENSRFNALDLFRQDDKDRCFPQVPVDRRSYAKLDGTEVINKLSEKDGMLVLTNPFERASTSSNVSEKDYSFPDSGRTKLEESPNKQGQSELSKDGKDVLIKPEPAINSADLPKQLVAAIKDLDSAFTNRQEQAAKDAILALMKTLSRDIENGNSKEFRTELSKFEKETGLSVRKEADGSFSVKFSEGRWGSGSYSMKVDKEGQIIGGSATTIGAHIPYDAPMSAEQVLGALKKHLLLERK